MTSPGPTHAATGTPHSWLLRAEGLTKTYGQTTALIDAHLDLHVGEAVAIMGPSGSGKSTLLHVMAGIIDADHGTVSVRSPGTGTIQEIATLPDAQRSDFRLQHFGFVFQQGMLIPELTAEENVALPLMLQNVPRTAAVEQANRALDGLGLSELGHRRIGQLSGGQAQRVALARALVTEPSVVFADEPTGALDSRTAEEVLDAMLTAVTDSTQRSMIIVTHDESIAARCDRTVRLLDGRIEGQR